MSAAPPWPLAHIALAVPDLDAAAEALGRLYGATAGEVRENAAQGVRLRYLSLPGLTLELLSPVAAETPVGRFLARQPAGGLHHLCFAVPDLDAACGAVTAAGGRVLGAPGTARNTDGARIAFVHPSATAAGLLVELEEHAAGKGSDTA
jgi:methylmalonyl-CoA/ethylmalonyl-CoA epimerase